MSQHLHAHPHEDPMSHVSPPSFWPILAALGAGVLFTGVVLYFYGSPLGIWSLLVGGVLALGSLIGWATEILTQHVHDPDALQRMLNRGFLFFLVSEAAIFAAFFAHYYYQRILVFESWPPAGAPKLETQLPAIATLILLTSGVTARIARSSFVQKGKRGAAKSWILITVVLASIFLAIEAYEWGLLKEFDNFTHQTTMAGTYLYVMTGFHALHVLTGIVLWALVYLRLELGHMSPRFHFSFNAAGWYWDFVDLVWVFLFFSIYLI
ncbi:MAG: heme-copper oxidase subunit III [Bacteroidetes bacterium]|nr:heme-copper oxidase subunit III [Rhodothermia bacterium]MCS7154930.1 heme-copper oxidase subunit III [Bacteroidota bacterium]MCX7906911.1 heme-copper oxidase subunit III [Bacteroidota bacterium]MDW8137725.1 cytochrome c oxidase subunit 3 [Bacteroidota bacterium]MDW8285321.1 cytochrome c oxidase subunit 3 [Bacteroidota bacterium]